MANWKKYTAFCGFDGIVDMDKVASIESRQEIFGGQSFTRLHIIDYSKSGSFIDAKNPAEYFTEQCSRDTVK
jgi:hypothetical protein